jgi:hypothetical protein
MIDQRQHIKERFILFFNVPLNSPVNIASLPGVVAIL